MAPKTRSGGRGSGGEVERPVYSTAISDAVLSFLTLYSCTLLQESAHGHVRMGSRGGTVAEWQWLAIVAIGLSGVAAGVGTLRFAGFAVMRPLHEFLAGMSMFLTMPALGMVAIFAFVNMNPLNPMILGVLAILALAFLCFRSFPRQLGAHLQEQWVLVTSLFGILCVLFRSLFILIGRSGSGSALNVQAGWYGLTGSVLVMVAGGFGVKGSIQLGSLRLLNVDLFHYTMAAANVCLVHLFQQMWA